MSNSENIATRNRKARQEALRDYLESRGLVEHVIDLADKIGDESNKLPPEMITRIKISIDTRLRLINKYLPDLKSTEITGDPDSPLHFKASRLSDDELAAIASSASS
jgi:hypothetical protein